MTAAPIMVDDLVRVRRNQRSVMIRVEKVEYVPSGYVRLSGVRVRQSDRAMLSDVKRCELRRGYYFVPPDFATIVHRDQATASATATTRCPECGGYGYHENGTDDGRECESCGGSGVVSAAPVTA